MMIKKAVIEIVMKNNVIESYLMSKDEIIFLYGPFWSYLLNYKLWYTRNWYTRTASCIGSSVVLYLTSVKVS